MTPPLRFCFAVHLHQPVGNFDSVFEEHLRDVYRPLLTHLMDGEGWPVTMHVSGPLLDWLETHAIDFVDELGSHVRDGRIELLAAGHDEPILAVLSRADRLEQVARHREHLRARFGVDATGLWLTERVWEPNLPEDLVTAGIRFALVDDRHFRVAGFPRERLHSHFRTEAGGQQLSLFPISEQLRYLVPFRPPEELAGHLRALRTAGHALAVLGDDGEKFGGWPGTREWVYEKGWIDRFLTTMRELRDSGEVVFSRFDDALANTASGGLAYLPSASYREMEGWSLPTEPARALLRLERDWDGDRIEGVEGALLRGSHWRNFFVKYPEANRLHKAVTWISALARERGDPPTVRRAIGRAQCNDAYWHGVFGGLYLPFLRYPLWQSLARAEAELRAGEGLMVERIDFDADGHDELWVHSAECSIVVAPSRGGAVEMLLDLVTCENAVDVLTRYREAYHEPLEPAHDKAAHEVGDGGAPSIHALEGQLTELPPTDQDARALFVDRIVAAEATLADCVAGTIPISYSWSRTQMTCQWTTGPAFTDVTLHGAGLTKTLRIHADGAIDAEWTWNAPESAELAGAWFATELSFASSLEIEAPGAEAWDYPIETVAKSERGFDRLRQGNARVLRWPLAAGRARVTVRFAAEAAARQPSG